MISIRFKWSNDLWVEATASDINALGEPSELEIQYLNEYGDEIEWEHWPAWLDKDHNIIEEEAKEQLYKAKYEGDFYIGAY